MHKFNDMYEEGEYKCAGWEQVIFISEDRTMLPLIKRDYNYFRSIRGYVNYVDPVLRKLKKKYKDDNEGKI